MERVLPGRGPRSGLPREDVYAREAPFGGRLGGYSGGDSAGFVRDDGLGGLGIVHGRSRAFAGEGVYSKLDGFGGNVDALVREGGAGRLAVRASAGAGLGAGVRGSDRIGRGGDSDDGDGEDSGGDIGSGAFERGVGIPGASPRLGHPHLSSAGEQRAPLREQQVAARWRDQLRHHQQLLQQQQVQLQLRDHVHHQLHHHQRQQLVFDEQHEEPVFDERQPLQPLRWADRTREAAPHPHTHQHGYYHPSQHPRHRLHQEHQRYYQQQQQRFFPQATSGSVPSTGGIAPRPSAAPTPAASPRGVGREAAPEHAQTEDVGTMDTRRPLKKYKRPLPPKHTPVSSDAETQIALERYLAVSGWLGLLLLLL